MCLIIHMMNVFKDRIKSITFNHVYYNYSYISSDKNFKDLSYWLQSLRKMEKSYTDLEFGELKFNLEDWYYKIGGKEITFHYHTDYLMTPGQAATELGISNCPFNMSVCFFVYIP